MLIAKYCDHLPLYRQSVIYARDGVDLERALLASRANSVCADGVRRSTASLRADWVGKAAALMAPLAEAVGRHALAGSVLHADDTPVPVLDPGRGKTKTGRLWVYLRDERPHAGPVPPAVLYRYTPDRRGEHPQTELAGFRGHLHADGYAGFDALYEAKDGRPATVAEVACMAHVRRKIFDVHAATGSPLAEDALKRIALLFAIEREVTGQPPEERRRVRQAKARPVIDGLALFLDTTLDRIPGRSELAAASATRDHAGRRSPAILRTVAWRYPTMQPSAASAPWPLADETGCSPAPTKVASVPRRSTPSWKRRRSMA